MSANSVYRRIYVAAFLAGCMATATGVAVADEADDRVMDSRPADDPFLVLPINLSASSEGATYKRSVAPDMRCTDVTSLSQALTLRQAFAFAVCASPKLKIASNAVLASAAAHGESRAVYLPNVSTGINLSRSRLRYGNDDVPGDQLTTRPSQLTLAWRLFDFGTRGERVMSNELLVNASVQSYETELRQLLIAVAAAYFEAAQSKATAAIRSVQEMSTRRMLESQTARYGRGVASAVELIQTQTSVNRANAELTRAQAAEARTRVALNVMLGCQPAKQWSFSALNARPSEQQLPEIEEWLKSLPIAPAVLSARLKSEAVRHKWSGQQAESLPTVDLNLAYYRNGRTSQSPTALHSREMVATVMLTVPIFDGFANNYRAMGVAAQIGQSLAEIDDALDSASADAAKAYTDADNASKSFRSAENILKLQKLTLDSVRRRLQGGVADELELRSAEVALHDAEIELIRATSELSIGQTKLLILKGENVF